MEQDTTWQWYGQSAILIGTGESTYYYYCKRCLDIVLASIALILLFPVMVAIAILIKLDSPGPIFFVQTRVGSRRRSSGGYTVWEIQNFPVFKFRSMTHNADETLHRAYIKAFVAGNAQPSGSGKLKYKLTDDPRITTVGHILRRTSLDELPQLFNVLRGEMSLVGPRPVPEYEVAEYREAWHHTRLATLPGITGLWQVKARCQVEFEEMIRLDLEYINHQSLWLDLKILLLTIPAVFSEDGAE